MFQPLWFCPLCQREGTDATAMFCPDDGGRLRPIVERGADWIGQVLDGKYRVVRFIDAGGMAEVYEAMRVGSGRPVALKLLHASLAANVEAMERFRHEAELIALIAHPNVVSIQDFGTLPSSVHYMVMELLDGETLQQIMARRLLPPLTVLRYAMQACEGLAAAHERGVVHCDMKPANLFLQAAPEGGEPVVKILDLGIGRLLAQSRRGVADIGLVSGTPDYMSPEQALGGEIGPASDIYSMGVVLYEMLLGKLPFADSTVTHLLARHVQEPPSWPADLARLRGVPPEVRDVVLQALAKEPADRQPSMLDLQRGLAAVAHLLRGGPSTSTTSPDTGATQPVARADVAVRPSLAGVEARDRGSSRPSRPVLLRVPLARATGADAELAELAPDVYWVGRRQGASLECNAYLRVFRRGDFEVSVLVDPGPPKDLGVVWAKVASVIGSIRRLDYVFLNHQDPDVASNAAAIQQASPRTRVLCSIDTWRLARFYGLDAERFTAVDGLPGSRTTLATGHELIFVPTPFCHFRGAVALFDPESRVLFSGDLFGGAHAPGLVADDRSWPGVKMFHQIYMPSQRALRLAAARIRNLVPAPTIIAPQHGAVIVAADVARMVDDVANLDVGLDLIESGDDATRFVAAANDILREYADMAGADRAHELLASHGGDGTFTSLFVSDGPTIVAFKVAPRLAIEALVGEALAALPAARRGELQRSIFVIWREHDLESTGMAPRQRSLRIDRR